jgi:hypothetical protein
VRSHKTAPWAGLDASIADTVAPLLSGLVDEVLSAVAEQVSPYAAALEGSFGQQVRAGVELALRGFVELLRAGPRAELPARDVYVQLGRGEFRAGRTLDALLAAYRVGAQVAWRRVAFAAEDAGASSQTLIVLAEAIFAYIDELSAASAEGHAEAAAQRAGEHQQSRRRLIELLVREPAPTSEELTHASDTAGWRVPTTLAMIRFEHPRPERLTPRLPPDALVVHDQTSPSGDSAPVEFAGTIGVAVIPDPAAPGHRAQVAGAFSGDGVRAAVGPTVPVLEAAISLAWASRAIALAEPGRGILTATDRLFDLLLLADPPLTRELATSRLAPLDALTPGARARLEATLRAWLDSHGQIRTTAQALHVHVQTVRYRLGQLRDLLGATIDQPEGRLELAIALRARELLTS